MKFQALTEEHAGQALMSLKPQWTRSKLSKFLFKNKNSRKDVNRLMRDIFVIDPPPDCIDPVTALANICEETGKSERLAFEEMMHDVLNAFRL